MTRKDQNYYSQSVKIINAFLSSVVVAYFFQPFVFFEVMGITAQGRLAKILFTSLIGVNILFYSGIYGVLVEMASGETWLFSLKRFWFHVKRYWWIVALMFFLFFVIHLSVFIYGGYAGTPLFLRALWEIATIMVVAGVIIFDKYKGLLSFSQSSVRFSIKDIGIGMTILILPGLFSFLQNILSWLPALKVCLFASKYFHLLGFIYISKLFLVKGGITEGNFEQDKEVFFINPCGAGLINFFGSLLFGFVPPAFVSLRALTPKSYRIREINRAIWQEKYYRPNKLVAITCLSSNSPEAYKIAREFKKRGSTVIMGGPHVTFLPEEALEYCDSVVIGEAEGVWPQIINDFENNNLKKFYLQPVSAENLSKVQQFLLSAPASVISNSIEAMRGCKFRCDFCSVPGLFNNSFVQKPVDEVVALVREISHKCKVFNFLDSNIYSDTRYAKELFRQLKGLNVRWAGACSLDIAKDDEALRLAKESGCVSLLIGYETCAGSKEFKRGKYALLDDYIYLTNKIKKMGILIKAHFMIGFDADHFLGLFRLWQFCFRLQPGVTAVTVITPFPGTSLYRRLLEEERIMNLNWRKYTTQTVVIKPKNFNRILLAVTYPVVYVIFFLTTCITGYLYLFSIILILLAAKVL